MAKRLFVGGLPYSTTSAQLEEMFAKVGKVTSVTLISDRFTGKSKGFGFVDMDDDAEADKAIETLNGTEVEGRKIIVNVARPMEERAPRERRDFGGGGQGGRGGFGGRGHGSDRRNRY